MIPAIRGGAGTGTIGRVSVEIRRASDRFVERSTGLQTWHSLSFGKYYDPERLSFGPMVCHDEHLLGSGRGFDEHRHEGLEIVSWVVSGTLEHRSSLGETVSIPAGSGGWLTAGAGVEHAEHASADGPVRFVQVWLSGSHDADPAWRPLDGSVVEVGSSSFRAITLDPGEAVTVPAARRVHLFVASGALLRSSLAEPLGAGDAFWMTDEPDHDVRAAVPTELLVWSFAE